ncbi:MAG TPA: hypothetical protein DHN29_15970 [Cytophagales bacterium]|nr:hypothetical protein [Cytophagales bacterium]|tara:strand:- start:1570 stop:1764 length:195 start_codon:yes stop_codon:yes gene_type:complete
MGVLIINEETILECIGHSFNIEPRHVQLRFDYNDHRMLISAEISVAETNIDRQQVGKAFTTHDI